MDIPMLKFAFAGLAEICSFLRLCWLSVMADETARSNLTASRSPCREEHTKSSSNSSGTHAPTASANNEEVEVILLL